MLAARVSAFCILGYVLNLDLILYKIKWVVVVPLRLHGVMSFQTLLVQDHLRVGFPVACDQSERLPDKLCAFAAEP